MGNDASSVASFGCAIDRDFVSGITTLAITGRLSGGNAAVAQFAVRRCLADQPLAVVLDLNAVSATEDFSSAPLFASHSYSRDPPATLLVHARRDSAIGRLVRARFGGDVSSYDTRNQALAAARAATPVHRRHRYLAPDPVAAAAARACVVGACKSWEVAHLADDAALIASELVTNAVVHARSELDFTAVLHAGRLRVAVRDRSPRRPRIRPSNVGRDRLAVGGRGLRLVEGLAAACGVLSHADGKTVWAILSTDCSDERRRAQD